MYLPTPANLYTPFLQIPHPIRPQKKTGETRKFRPSYISIFSYLFFFKFPSTDCSTMKKHKSADSTIRTHQLESVPCVVIRLEMVPFISTPKMVPNGVPTPPLRSVPPITADEMASISSPFACSTNPAQLFKQNKNPPQPAKIPSKIYAFSFVFFTSRPIIMALCAFPPTAYTLRPNFVNFITRMMMTTISSAITTVG